MPPSLLIGVVAVFLSTSVSIVSVAIRVASVTSVTRISSVHVASATLALSIVLVAVTLFSFFDDANAILFVFIGAPVVG